IAAFSSSTWPGTLPQARKSRSTPDIARCTEAGSARSPAATSTSGPSRCAARPGARTNYRPTVPVAAVTRMVIGVLLRCDVGVAVEDVPRVVPVLQGGQAGQPV